MAGQRQFSAAAQGHALAQSNLGLMYDTGRGVAQNDAEAIKWYRMAAEQGYGPAQSNLGVKYARGQGVPRDNVRAHMWYSLAASRSASAKVRHLAQQDRDAVATLMTSAQIAEAEELARAWRPRGELAE